MKSNLMNGMYGTDRSVLPFQGNDLFVMLTQGGASLCRWVTNRTVGLRIGPLGEESDGWVNAIRPEWGNNNIAQGRTQRRNVAQRRPGYRRHRCISPGKAKPSTNTSTPHACDDRTLVPPNPMLRRFLAMDDRLRFVSALDLSRKANRSQSAC